MSEILSLYAHADDEYINMEVIQNREFEFQMSFSFNDHDQKQTTAADELFFNGKLLPLHHPSRPQMLENLLHSTTTWDIIEEDDDDDYYSMAFITCSGPPCITTNNIPPLISQSCRMSFELKPDEYFSIWSTELSPMNIKNIHPAKNKNKPWFKKLKLIKHSIIGHQKLMKAYLKSFFIGNSICSDDSCAKEKHLKIGKKKPFEHISRASCPKKYIGAMNNNGIDDQRGFFSPTKSTSSTTSSSSSSSSLSSSFNSNRVHELDFLRGRSSGHVEIEVSIDAAIDHCKKSLN